MKIAIIDPFDSWRNLLFRVLVDDGHEVRRSQFKTEGWGLIRELNPDVVVCEYRFRDGDGPELASMIRSSFPATTVIFVTRRTDIASIVAAYHSGADLYIKKPTSVDEVLAAILASGRKLRSTDDISYEYLRIDKATGMILADENEVRIGSERDLQVLIYFMRNPNRVISERDVYSAVWGFEKLGDPSQINRSIRRINKVLKQHGDVAIYPAAIDGYVLSYRKVKVTNASG